MSHHSSDGEEAMDNATGGSGKTNQRDTILNTGNDADYCRKSR